MEDGNAKMESRRVQVSVLRRTDVPLAGCEQCAHRVDVKCTFHDVLLYSRPYQEPRMVGLQYLPADPCASAIQEAQKTKTR